MINGQRFFFNLKSAVLWSAAGSQTWVINQGLEQSVVQYEVSIHVTLVHCGVPLEATSTH